MKNITIQTVTCIAAFAIIVPSARSAGDKKEGACEPGANCVETTMMPGNIWARDGGASHIEDPGWKMMYSQLIRLLQPKFMMAMRA